MQKCSDDSEHLQSIIMKCILQQNEEKKNEFSEL